MELMKTTLPDGKILEIFSDGTWKYASDAGKPTSLLKAVVAGDGFRSSAWGMSKEEVKVFETLEMESERDDVLVYPTRMAEKDFDAIYIFFENQLVRGKYMLLEQYTNENSYVDDGIRLSELLSKKYGSPSEEDQIWLSDTYKGDYDNRGRAVEVGELIFTWNWETPETSILLIVSGENFETNVTIQYSSKSLAGLEKAAMERDALEGL